MTLQRLVSEHVNAEVILTASTNDALLTLADVPADVILTSSLLSADDDEQLAAHLRATPDLDHLPILSIPPLVEIQESRERTKGLWSYLLRRRREPQPSPAYDFGAIAARIEHALEQSKSDAPESEMERPARMLLLERGKMRLLGAGQPQAITSLVRLGEELDAASALRERRARARRWNGDDLSWLSGVRLVWGTELRLLNISSTGLLVESDLQLTLGKTCFQLEGCDREQLIVPASVVRAESSGEDPHGATYVVAAVFDRPFEALGPVRSLRELRRFQQRPSISR